MRIPVLLVILISSFSAFGQKNDSLRRHTIKLDITTRWLYRDAYVIAYERVLNPKRTVGIVVGYQTLPGMLSLGPGIFVQRDVSASGFKAGAEYRFYLAKENKFAAPHGVYIGPYFSYNAFRNERDIVIQSTGEYTKLNMKLDVLNIGVQLGYQFVFNDRWTVDLSFLGPAIANYRTEMSLGGGNFSGTIDDIAGSILEDLITRFPGLGDLLSGKTVTKSGKADAWAAGFRYQIQLGYRFGKKK